MENFKGKMINIYDGLLEQCTTAELLKCLRIVDGKERWLMITKEGDMVIRYL